MVNVRDPKYKRMKKAERDKYLNKLTSKADEKIADIEFITEIINDYKTKLNTEKAKN